MTLPANLASKLPHWLIGGGVGVGATVALMVAERDPHSVIETFKGWGPLSFLALVMLAMIDRASRSMTDGLSKSAAAQQELADAVRQIAARDNNEAYEQRVLMGHIATQTEKILTRFEDLEKQMEAQRIGAPDRRDGAHA
jgi:hypothetical protein